MKKIYFLLFAIALSNLSVNAQSTATYTITFDSNWSQASHPHSSGNLPGNAHWSKLVGAVHSDEVTFFEMGEVVSQGMENIAELGSNAMFFSEVTTEINNGTALSIIDGPDLDTSLGTIEITGIEFNEDFSYVTLASMIAPSPDWIIGVSSQNLRDTNGDWEDQIVLDLYAYDAGTDSGTDYTSPNMDTNPADPMTSLQGITPFSNEIIGTITFDLEEVLNIADINNGISLRLFPNPTDGLVTIKSNRNLKQITLHNVLGKKIKEIINLDSDEIQINIDDLPQGVYLVSILDSENKNSSKKLVKI